MSRRLHITSGDIAGDKLARSGVAGEILVWHDILYEGPRNPGWPTAGTLAERADFLDKATGGGLGRDKIIDTLRAQYHMLEQVPAFDEVVLWFDACLFDQTMLAHVLTCMNSMDAGHVTLICIDSYPAIDPYHGLGQLPPEHLAAAFPERRPVSREHYIYAERVDRGFARQDKALLRLAADEPQAPLPWMPAAIRRWLQEQPDETTGLGLLERLALAAAQAGWQTPPDIFKAVAASDTPPQYWGDTTLWAKINGLTSREPPYVTIAGPSARLPQWSCQGKLDGFRIAPTEHAPTVPPLVRQEETS